METIHLKVVSRDCEWVALKIWVGGNQTSKSVSLEIYEHDLEQLAETLASVAYGRRVRCVFNLADMFGCGVARFCAIGQPGSTLSFEVYAAKGKSTGEEVGFQTAGMVAPDAFFEFAQGLALLSIAPEKAEVALALIGTSDGAISREIAFQDGIWGPGAYVRLHSMDVPEFIIPDSIDGQPVVSFSSTSKIGRIDASSARSLKWLKCPGNHVEEIELPHDGQLVALDCSLNLLREIKCGGQRFLRVLSAEENALQSIDFENLPSLKWLSIGGNGLECMDLTRCRSLDAVDCQRNELRSLTLPRNSSIRILACSDNRLTQLDVSELVGLESLDCSRNSISRFLLGKKPVLHQLRCGDNAIERLMEDSDSLPALEELYCFGNVLTDASYFEKMMVEGTLRGQIHPQSNT